MIGFGMFILAAVLVVLLGMKTKVNMGIWALAATIIIGVIISGLSISEISQSFPVNMVLNFFLCSVFYGFSIRNGTIAVLAGKLLFRFSGKTNAVPFIIFTTTAVISMLGPSSISKLIIAPTAYAISMAAGMDPFLSVAALWCGSNAPMLFPWTMTGSVNLGNLQNTFGTTVAYSSTYLSGTIQLVFSFLQFLILWMVFRPKTKDFNTMTCGEKEFSKAQKRTAVISALSLALIVIPSLTYTAFPTELTAKMAGIISPQLVWTVGIIVLSITDCGELKKVIVEEVNWNTMVLVCGMTMMFSVAARTGVLSEVQKAAEMVSSVLVLPCLSVFCGVLSAFVSCTVIPPMFFDSAQSLAENAGTALPLVIAIICSSGMSCGISPASTGGALCLAGIPKETDTKPIIRKMFLLAIMDIPAYFLFTLIIVSVFG